MKTLALILTVMMIGLSGSSQTLIQPYQVALSTNTVTLMTPAGCTNVSDFAKWVNGNWHTLSGYAKTNQLNAYTNNLNSLSNSLTSSLSNSLASNSNTLTAIVASVPIITNYFIATNSAIIVTGSGVAQKMACSGEIIDDSGMNLAGEITIPKTGTYRIGCKADFSHNNQTTSNPRMIMKLFKGVAEHSTMHRHQLQDAGSETVISSDIEIKAVANETYSIQIMIDGSMYATNAVGAVRLWAVQERN